VRARARAFVEIADPTDPDDLAIFNEGKQALEDAENCIDILNAYEGCQELIRQAMANSSNEAIQLSSFEGMFPNIERIKTFYNLAKNLDGAVEKIVTRCVATGEYVPALLKLLASILSAALRFDRAKMMHPAIQNDFSQYRRVLQKRQNHPGLPVKDAEANAISMFIAQASPLIAELSLVLNALSRNQKDVSKFLADFSHICCAFVMREKTHDSEHALLALTAMVVGFILYDNVNPTGVFAKGSQIDVKTCVGQIRVVSDADKRGMLCDTLHYSTRSFEKAPDNIKRVIESR